MRCCRSFVFWLGRAATYALGLLVLAALLIGPVSYGLAAVGDPMLLGKTNDAVNKATSILTALGGPVLRLTNEGGGPGLELKVEEGAQPLTVNRTTKVKRLNADLLDGKTAADFLPAAGTAANAEKLDGKTAAEFLGLDGTAANADRLDGKTAADFLDANGTAADADKLDGREVTAFIRSGISTYEVEVAGDADPATDGRATTASCDNEDLLQSGGFVNLSSNGRIVSNAPANGREWRVKLESTNGSTATVTVRARCFDLPPLRP